MGSSGAATSGGTVNLYPVIRLKDGYSGNPGCLFDGSDERAAAQAIIDAAPAGSVVEFYPGTLGLGGTLKLKAQVTYRGTTVFGCVIKLLSSASGAAAVVAAEGWTTAQNPAYTGNPLVIERLYIDGNKAQTAGANPGCHGLVLMNWQSTIRAVNVINTPGNGIHLADRTAAGVNLTNTSVENRIEDCRVETPDGDGIHVEDNAGRLTDGYCVNNIVNSANGTAIRIKRSSGWQVTGNHVYTGGGRGTSAIWCSAGFATIISRNYVDYYGQYYPGSTQYCMGVRLDALTGRGSVISNNVIAAPANLNVNNVYRHIHVEAGGGAASVSVQIRDNEIQGQGIANEFGLFLYAPSGASLTVRETGTTMRGVLEAYKLSRSGVGVIDHRVGDTPQVGTDRGILGTGLIPNTTGTQLYSHNSGTGVGGMLSDAGRMVIQRFKTIKRGNDAVLVYGNFMSQQQPPGELEPPNSIRVRAALISPFGTPKYVSSSMTYSAATAYAVDDLVVYSGSFYVSLQGSNTNHTPSTNPDWWTLCSVTPIRFRGARDVTIDPGGHVVSDRAGIGVLGGANIGVATLVQPLTRAGVPVGSVTSSVTYNAGSTYAAGDVVVYNSRYYESLQGSNTGNTPATAGTAFWGPVVYPYGLTAYTAGTNPDWLATYAATAGGITVTDNTTTPPTANTASTTFGYGPMVVLMRPAQAEGRQPLIAGFGDSIFNGANDGQLFVNEPGGYFSRAINGAYCHLRINKSGDALKYWATDTGVARTGRAISRAMLAGCTHAICEMGTNDIGTSTLAVMQVKMLAAWWMMRDRGILAWQTTITPQTTSTDAWATVGNQTASTNFGAGSVWEQLNAWIAAGGPIDPSTLSAVAVGTSGALVAGAIGHPLRGVIDIQSACCDATVTWAWKAGSTSDGVHPNSTTYAAMAALVPIATIAAVEPLPLP